MGFVFFGIILVILVFRVVFISAVGCAHLRLFPFGPSHFFLSAGIFTMFSRRLIHNRLRVTISST